MKKLLFVCLLGIFLPVFAEKNLFKIQNSQFLAQNDSTFDPFIDYGEFQDDVTEQENINFFQNGRSLNLSILGGYEAVTWNIGQIYGDSPLVFGMAISFFFDLHFAFQINGFFPYGHYNSLFNNTAQFSHYGIDLKYYLNKQYIGKNADFFNPYFSFGPFWINLKNQLPQSSTPQKIGIITTPNPKTDPPQNPETPTPKPGNLEKEAVGSFSAFGAKIGLGFEMPLIKQTFIGAEISYLYTNLEFENEDLSNWRNLPPINYNPNQNLITRRQFPNRPQTASFRFFGDLMNLIILFGVNF